VVAADESADDLACSVEVGIGWRELSSTSASLLISSPPKVMGMPVVTA
jgi:hypothetical protein